MFDQAKLATVFSGKEGSCFKGVNLSGWMSKKHETNLWTIVDYNQIIFSIQAWQLATYA